MTLRIAIILGVLAYGSLSWASVSACTGGTTLNNYQPPDVQTGCAYIDNSFTNLRVNGAQAGDGSPSVVTLTSNPAVGDVLNSTSGLGVADFTSPIWTSTGSSTPQTNIEYVVEAHTGDTIGGYTYTDGVNGYVTPAATAWAISSFTLDISGAHGTATGGANSILNIDEIVCLGDTTGNCTFGSPNAVKIEIDASSQNSNQFFLVTNLCGGPGMNATAGQCGVGGFSESPDGLRVTYTLATPVQAVSVIDFVAVGLNGGTGTSTLNDLYNGFGEVAVNPEPGTFVLIGAALALLAARTKMRAARRNHDLL